MIHAAPAPITLHPGDVAIASRGDRLETLLGSCVAIVLTDPRRTAGVMCHIVHSGPATGRPHTSAVHADVALGTMVRLLRERGLAPALCESWVFGGGNMFPRLADPAGIGDANADWALNALDGMGVRVLGVDVGGAVYRRLAWTVGTGAPEVHAVPL